MSGPDRSIEERLDDLERIQAIKDLKERYWTAWDNKRVIALISCFSAEGVDIDYGPGLQFRSRDQIGQLLANQISVVSDGSCDIVNRHEGLRPAIELTSASTAHGTWTVHFLEINAATRTMMSSAGYCQDDYVLEDGDWKIRRSVYTNSWMASSPLGGEITVARSAAQDVGEH